MYIKVMLRINVYIPEDLNKKLDFMAQAKHKAKAEVIRKAIEKGLEETQPHLNQGLIELVRLAEKISFPPHTPTDVSENHDYYAWGGKKRK